MSEYSHQDSTTYEQDWQRYWSQQGEQIIWQSWIDKYKMYINPEYLDKSTEEVQPKQEDIERTQELAHRNQMLIRNLSGSDSYDKLNNVQSDGWNQLSPTHNDLEENERLLNSRCGSVASSTAKTFATTDSMTNVTHLTVSSVDLSDSSKSSESMSSPISSMQSSDHSSYEGPEETMDSDQYWQVLWKKHYEQQFKESYNKFMSTRQTQGAVRDSSPSKSSKRNRYKQKSDHETQVSNLMETLAVQDEENKTNDIR